MHVPSAMTIMPPEPSMLPACCSDGVVERERLDFAGREHRVEMPPGMTALSGLPPRMPPQSS